MRRRLRDPRRERRHPGRTAGLRRTAGWIVVIAAGLALPWGSAGAVLTGGGSATGSFPPTVTSHSSSSAGYFAASTPGSFSLVNGMWRQPSLRHPCSLLAVNETALIWDGLDGAVAKSTTLERAGTGFTCTGGAVTNFGFYGYLANRSIQVVGQSVFAFATGDLVQAIVQRSPSGNSVSFYLVDKSTGTWFSATRSVPGAKGDTVEWMVSRVSNGTGFDPFPSFTPTTVSNCTTTNGILTNGLPHEHRLTMTNGTRVLAKAGPVTKNGSSCFTYTG